MKLGIMLSGRGSTYEAIHQAILNKSLTADISHVLSSNPNAAGLKYAQLNGHTNSLVDPKKDNHHDFLNDFWSNQNIDLIVMAGYVHFWKLSPELQQKTINLHPSLIPAFSGKGMYGMHVHRAVIEKGVKFSGCTVHLVDGAYDHGEILDQRCIAVESTDTAETLAAKIGPLEKSLLIQVISNWGKQHS
jgi:phosphoribosylglycinamide formyltransferase-1